jgi:alkane 1-monooxygenase
MNGGKNSFFNSLFNNRLISFTLCEALYFLIIYFIFGGRGLAFHIVTNIIVLQQFEAVNYLEHYGLERKLENGVYESVKITHSWNAPQVFTNWFLFKLQRHSDHHANAYKPYQILDSFVESPMLPYGYSVSLLVVIFPSIWRKIIDPLAIATNKGEKITKEEQDNIERWIFIVLISTTIAFTYLTFIGIGLTPML